MAYGAIENVLRLGWRTPKAFGAAPEDGRTPSGLHPIPTPILFRSSGLRACLKSGVTDNPLRPRRRPRLRKPGQIEDEDDDEDDSPC